MGGGLAARIGALVGVPVAGMREAGSSHGVRHLTGTLADGRAVFVKAADGVGPPDALAAEANGLRWLADAGAVPVPAVLGADERTLVVELLPAGSPTPATARAFGAGLARLHATGAPAFGAPWPGYIASLPLDNTLLDTTPLDNTLLDTTPLDNTLLDTTLSDQPDHAWVGNAGQSVEAADWESWYAQRRVPPYLRRARDDGALSADWGSWYAQRRVLPYLRRARDDGALSAADVRAVEAVLGKIAELAGPAEPPSRIHGDLWAGNVLWPDGVGALIDPAAHGGHRETDLAMLALFGAPHREEILRGYTETAPLADGWRARIPLHQLHPLLVHACLFGVGYASRVTAAARAALRR